MISIYGPSDAEKRETQRVTALWNDNVAKANALWRRTNSIPALGDDVILLESDTFADAELARLLLADNNVQFQLPMRYSKYSDRFVHVFNQGSTIANLPLHCVFKVCIDAKMPCQVALCIYDKVVKRWCFSSAKKRMFNYTFLLVPRLTDAYFTMQPRESCVTMGASDANTVATITLFGVRFGVANCAAWLPGTFPFSMLFEKSTVFAANSGLIYHNRCQFVRRTILWWRAYCALVQTLLSCGLAPYVVLDVWNIFLAQTINISVEIESAVEHGLKISLIEAMQAIVNERQRMPAIVNRRPAVKTMRQQ